MNTAELIAAELHLSEPDFCSTAPDMAYTALIGTLREIEQSTFELEQAIQNLRALTFRAPQTINNL